MQTAAATPEQVSEGLSSGAHYYLTKPFKADALLSIVRAAVQDGARWEEVSQKIANHSKALNLLVEAKFSVKNLGRGPRVVGAYCPRRQRSRLGSVRPQREILINGIEHGNLEIDFQTKKLLKGNDCWADEIQKRLNHPAYKNKRVCIYVTKEGTEFKNSD